MNLLSGLTPVRVRQKASHCMGAFSVVLNQQQLFGLADQLMKRIAAGKTKLDKMIQVQCLALVAKTVGNKLAPFLSNIVPTLAQMM